MGPTSVHWLRMLLVLVDTGVDGDSPRIPDPYGAAPPSRKLDKYEAPTIL